MKLFNSITEYRYGSNNNTNNINTASITFWVPILLHSLWKNRNRINGKQTSTTIDIGILCCVKLFNIVKIINPDNNMIYCLPRFDIGGIFIIYVIHITDKINKTYA